MLMQILFDGNDVSKSETFSEALSEEFDCTGTGTIEAGTKTITGTDTDFRSEKIYAGNSVTINGETHVVNHIDVDPVTEIQTLTLVTNHTAGATDDTITREADPDIYTITTPTVTGGYYDNSGTIIDATDPQMDKQLYDGMATFQEAKDYLIAKAKEECGELITATYEFFKQHNLSANAHANPNDNAYTAQRSFIDQYRTQCDDHETAINLKTTTQQLADYELSWTDPT